MRVFIVMVLATWLAACGADGEPVQPTAQAGAGISFDGMPLGTTLEVTV